ncbi:MAG: DUF459 domain-containing protein [Acidimicrobiia bacterium]|nr:DUF459 domain-containing protein [Acidimicrobiia bacterium]
MLVRPIRSPRPGTMPAGLALMIMAVGLFGALLVNAEAMARTSRGQPDNPEWRTSVIDGIAAVSGFFHLTAPRSALDDRLGKNQTDDADIDAVLAERASRAEAAEEAARRAEEAAAAAALAPPELRVPTPEAPLRVYVAGDSMAGGLGPAFQRVGAETGLVSVQVDYRVSSGLVRPDFFNWPQHLARQVVDVEDPDVVVVQFGANDMQNIALDGAALPLGSEEWLAEYRRRVAGTMDLLQAPSSRDSGPRLVLWMGLPPVGPNSGIDPAMVDHVNHIYASEAASRPWVVYVDTWAYLAGEDGYAKRLVNADGQDREMRAGDDVHLSVPGAQRLAWALLDRLGGLVDLSASEAVPPESETAPPGLEERVELPVPSPLS